MLRDLRRSKRAQRRGVRASRWCLYESPMGTVPKDLVTMFAGIATPQIVRSARPLLTDGERGALSEVLDFIDRHGIWKLLGVADTDGEVSPSIQKVRSAKGPLFELEIQGGRHNPRFLFVVCSDVVVFLTAFSKKRQKLRRVDIARADDRFQTMKDACS